MSRVAVRRCRVIFPVPRTKALARRAPWIGEWVAEVVGFPRLAHDDRADAAAMALRRVRGRVEPYRAVLAPRRVVDGDEPGVR